MDTVNISRISSRYFLRYLEARLMGFIPHKVKVHLLYMLRLNRLPNFSKPVLYNEWIQWLKLNWRDPLVQVCTDKLAVRNYIANIAGEKYLVPLIGVWNSFEEVPWEKLPDSFVIKLTHDSGSVEIVEDKSRVSVKHLHNKFYWLSKIDHSWWSGEWNYKGLVSRIIVERYLGKVKDYKVFCFNGKPAYIQVDIDRFGLHRRLFYSTRWEYYSTLEVEYPSDPNSIEPPPVCLDEMLHLSGKIAKPFPHVRVDWYIKDDTLYFGEMTFFHGSGLEKFSSTSWEALWGSLLFQAIRTKDFQW